MKTIYRLAICIFLGAGNFSYGSGALPCNTFVSSDHRFFLLSEAYKAADLVVIGDVTYSPNPTLKIRNKIKGNEEKREVQLTRVVCQGTACSGGFSVAPKIEMLFLLKQKGDVYDSATGNGNFSCPVVYEVEKSSVKFGKKLVSIESLKKYLEVKPDPIPFL